jgi:hypothetical protein
MQNMQNMLAYTIRSSNYSGGPPSLIIGMGGSATGMKPQNPQDDSYWIVIIDGMNPAKKVKEWVIPGQNNSTVPSDLDSFMSNPQYIFVVATQFLSTLHVPQGDLYDYLAKYGAGRQLQRLEQINSVLSCGSYGRMNYVLTGQCGPRGGNNPPARSYEEGSYMGPVLVLMALMPMPNGQPPYSIADHNAFRTR